MSKGYTNDFFRQFEEISNKLDTLLDEKKKIKEEHKKEMAKLKYDLIKEFREEKAELNKNIKSLTKQLQEANETIKKLQDDNDRLKNQINKNSSNSSKPSSSNFTTPRKKTSANEYNYRQKSNTNIGGQNGHIGHNLSKKDIEDLIASNKIKEKKIIHYIKGKTGDEPIIKYRVGIEINTYAEKHIFIPTENSNKLLPKEFYTDVTYDNSIKALSIELGTYNLIAYDRLSDFFNVITEGTLNISNGTLVNFLYEFSAKSEPTINEIKTNLLNSPLLYTDETGSKYNKKNIFVRNYSNEENVLYLPRLHKGHRGILDDNILPRFCGGIMGDHDTTLYSYGSKNYECNIHVGRYLEELIQNVFEIYWPVRMKELIFRMHNSRKLAIQFGSRQFNDDKIGEYKKEYLEILDIAKEENKTIKSSYYKEKANKLYRRMTKYMDNHLYFIEDFEVPFDDNLSERDLRIFKNKTKISGGFRTMNGAQSYVNALSIIKTSIKRNINPFDSIIAIFNNKILFAN